MLLKGAPQCLRAVEPPTITTIKPRRWCRRPWFLREMSFLERILKHRLGRGHLGLESRLQAVLAPGRLKANAFR